MKAPRWLTSEGDRRRFWEKVDVRGEDECWTWLGSKLSSGYGRIGSSSEVMPHRRAYRFLVGEIPEGLTLDHLCRNRACVNPRHLEPVTIKENILRGNGPAARNARKTHCAEGHPLSGKVGNRYCLICRRRKQREYTRTPAQRAHRTAYMRKWRERQRLSQHYERTPA